MKTKHLFSALIALCILSGCGESDEGLVIPNDMQLEWADAEIGVMIHYDMQVFNPDYQWRHWGTHPDASTYNPDQLNTDQWMEAASKLGAKYAVLVAKHCCGFSLWPTEAHDYSVKSCPWKDGKGDIVGDFIASCKKYNIKPGIYASTSANGYYHVDNPGVVQPGSPYTQAEYNAVVEKQLTELWGNYGDLFEVWFDGGVLAEERGGAKVAGLLTKLQPKAIAFQGPYGHPCLIRWVGNEVGAAPYPCWATCDSTTNADGTKVISDLNGDPQAAFWCPGESDFTLRHNSTRQGGWMWAPGEDDRIFDVPVLMEKYVTSVGRNTNMILGIVVDDHGLVPEGDVKRMQEYGDEIQRQFGSPLATTKGKGTEIILKLGSTPVSINRAIIQEDIAHGERILSYRLMGLNAAGEWQQLSEGTCVGHKKIDLFDPVEVSQVKLEVTESKAKPLIRTLSVFETLQ